MMHVIFLVYFNFSGAWVSERRENQHRFIFNLIQNGKKINIFSLRFLENLLFQKDPGVKPTDKTLHFHNFQFNLFLKFVHTQRLPSWLFDLPSRAQSDINSFFNFKISRKTTLWGSLDYWEVNNHLLPSHLHSSPYLTLRAPWSQNDFLVS